MYVFYPLFPIGYSILYLLTNNPIIGNIESEGPYAPQDLFLAAIRVIRSRLSELRRAAEALASGEDADITESVSAGIAHAEVSAGHEGKNTDVVMFET